MPWTLRIDAALLRRMQLWNGRYPGLLAALQQRMNDQLAADPDAWLGEVIPPTMTRPWYVELNQSDGVPEALVVTLYVNRNEAQRTLDLIQGRLATAQSPE